MVSSSAAAELQETTPLLSRIVDTPHVPEQKNTTKLIYSYVFGLLLLLVTFIYNIRSTLPTPLSDVQARELNDFPGIHCYNEYLSHFNQPHSANQRNNQVIKDWIVQLAHEFKVEATANGVPMEIIEDDPTDLVSKRNKFSTDEYWLVESRNVIIRLTGKSNNTSESFLVNAHYDSVSTSHGVTDNGMGTAVAIELLRYFVQHPPQHTVIFLFNNFEEGGLIGADAFVQHPWFSTIKLFVNLEGTGAGGRALLFRSNTLAAVHGLASSGAHLLHASPLGNDLLQAKLLKSDTDYTTFTKHGVPGLDIAFYTPRSHYHTQRDDLAHTTPESLQHMGQMALGSVLSIDNSDTMLDQAGAPEPVIYYDILGRVMLVYSFFTCQLVNMLALFCVPLGLFTWFWFSTTADIEDKAAETQSLAHRQRLSCCSGCFGVHGGIHCLFRLDYDSDQSLCDLWRCQHCGALLDGSCILGLGFVSVGHDAMLKVVWKQPGQHAGGILRPHWILVAVAGVCHLSGIAKGSSCLFCSLLLDQQHTGYGAFGRHSSQGDRRRQ
ncbi:unnamed protein product [Mucor fragilis]